MPMLTQPSPRGSNRVVDHHLVVGNQSWTISSYLAISKFRRLLSTNICAKMATSIRNITSIEELKQIQAKESKFILFFWAEWHELSNKASGQLQSIFQALASKYSASIDFYLVEAEVAVDISETCHISVVPSFLAYYGPKVIKKLEGANPAELNNLVKALDELYEPVQVRAESSAISLNDRLKTLITSAPVMLFMKGSPSTPRCGFSRQIIEILQKHDITFSSFDILSDEEVRQGLKTYSDWPTYPQLYVHGNLIGGLDIVKELESSGDLKKEFGLVEKEKTTAVSLEERLKALINQAPVMLFMKGSPETPRCGFSKKIVEILKSEEISFQTFDILSDEEVRQGLKTYSDWPTYPQLYVHGNLIGGLDIVNEMKTEGSLKAQLNV
jgi:Grx4 family monothiol glutaredoxin